MIILLKTNEKANLIYVVSTEILCTANAVGLMTPGTTWWT